MSHTDPNIRRCAFCGNYVHRDEAISVMRRKYDRPRFWRKGLTREWKCIRCIENDNDKNKAGLFQVGTTAVIQ